MDGAPSYDSLFPADGESGPNPDPSNVQLTETYMRNAMSEQLPMLIPVEGTQLLSALYPALGEPLQSLLSPVAPPMDTSDVSPYRRVLSAESKETIRESVYSGEEGFQCPITMRDISTGTSVATLPCGHHFDPDGLRTWLEKYDAKCPVCRYELPSEEVRAPPPPPEPATQLESPQLSELVRSLARLTLAQHQEDAQARIMRHFRNSAPSLE